ncbi:MAG: ABC transporter ATP-binding protein, partial [Gemmatimonadales bacterium]
GTVEAVRGLSFGVERGKTLGIVGESGSGKSVTAHSLLGLTNGATVSGRAVFDGHDLLRMPENELRRIRGARIAMIFQNPFTSLHPSHRVGYQVAEAIRIHRKAARVAARERAVELLQSVGIPHARERANDYPHQFSGGMLQRAMIAVAIALQPDLLIADEPTTALDTTVQAQILRLLQQLQSSLGMAMILITHDLSVVAGAADEVLVMYGGKVMESASNHVLYRLPHHPYTKGLMQSLPRPNAPLTPIPGRPAAAISPPTGCPFHPRCDHTIERCTSEQELVTIGEDRSHRSACWLPVK